MLKKIKSFTLIELLIVIVIIGILATAMIPRIQWIQNKAKYARVEKDFQDFRTAVFMAQSYTWKPLKDITLSAYTAWNCTTQPWYVPIPDIRNLSENHICRTWFLNALRWIASSAGMDANALDHLQLDPWGSPYWLDENEGEAGGCNKDHIRTVWPDGSLWKSNDNRAMEIRPYGCPWGY